MMCTLPFSTMALAESANSKTFFTKSPAAIILHPEALELATSFVENTLPNLIGDDPVLAAQLGFAPPDLQSFKESGAALETPFPMFVVSLQDIFKYVIHPSNPVELIKTEVNWIEGSDGTLIPARWLFPVELRNDAGKEAVVPRSSVIIAKSPSSPWRVHQVGGPNLVRAVKKFATGKTVSVMWIPGINRHYLGQVERDGTVSLKVLFDDPIAKVKAGYEFNPSHQVVINALKKLEEDLQLQEKLQTPAMPPSPTVR